jgi:hypothetical protein
MSTPEDLLESFYNATSREWNTFKDHVSSFIDAVWTSFSELSTFSFTLMHFPTLSSYLPFSFSLFSFGFSFSFFLLGRLARAIHDYSPLIPCCDFRVDSFDSQKFYFPGYFICCIVYAI